MDFEKDLFDQIEIESNGDPYELRPECIIVDKVFDACFQRECEPAKVIDLPPGHFKNPQIVYGPGFIVDGTLDITPAETNFARVRFCFRVPFTVTLSEFGDHCKKNDVTLNDYVEFCKDIKVFLPQAPSEFSFDIRLETRSETLRAEIVGHQLILAIGTVVVVKVVGRVQLLVQAFGYCAPPRECDEVTPEDICTEFLNRTDFPTFFPPQMEDINTL